MKNANTRVLALRAVHKHLEVIGSFDRYTGIVTLHGLARLATITGDPSVIEEARRQFMPFALGERRFPCNFPNYLCGGNGAAYMLWKGHLPEVESLVRRHADQILNEAPRDADGILCHPNAPEQGRVFIDVAFAISPFLLFAGLALDDEQYMEEAIQQTIKMVRLLRNPENGLIHQSRNFTGQLPGRISEDAWSRGNGWGAYALTELACYLPDRHPRKAEVVAMYRDHVTACARVQDIGGLWRQEMTEMDAYIETSGSALMLYAIGSGLSAGLLDASHRPRFERGIAALLAYISDELDIYHTCRGCLCPGNGMKLDYMARAPVVNDAHAFGPVVLAMGQAHALGIEQINRPSERTT
jgi:unsaturated rhamnogalacturonyl hydrolase